MDMNEKMKPWVKIAYYVCSAAVLIALLHYCGQPSGPYQATPMDCSMACSPNRMQSFEPAVGKCVCAP